MECLVYFVGVVVDGVLGFVLNSLIREFGSKKAYNPPAPW